ncbi:spore cortex biosynthesis protein YabQ [Ornithinibacillus halophilus]|uniref:Spore cortex biosynthesis protein YabQ n=1 Tax=Ornithinibacillus halophilus TaxID=930117 RepID=A0A1M5JJC5_9BACI|nr:spore cortex biosynthesis protein YabQ [Ornithinibacillus halophilus]SHG40598.1 spore cortex biosynthesis protein YabQ [Ornithinibacillus halophilus]
MTLNIQFLTMITMISGGFYLGMAVDTFRRFDRHWKSKKFLVYLLEVCFWLSQTFILYYLLFLVNSGELRFYVFAATLLGYATYQVIAANFYKRLLERLIVIIKQVYNFFERLFIALVYKPIKYLIQLLIAFIIFIVGMAWTVIQFCFKLLFAPIKWVFGLIYRLLPDKVKLFLHNLAGFYSKIKNIIIKWVKYISSKRR